MAFRTCGLLGQGSPVGPERLYKARTVHPCFQATQAALWTQMAFSEAVCGCEGYCGALADLGCRCVSSMLMPSAITRIAIESMLVPM